MGFPHDFYAKEAVRTVTYGGLLEPQPVTARPGKRAVGPSPTKVVTAARGERLIQSDDRPSAPASVDLQISDNSLTPSGGWSDADAGGFEVSKNLHKHRKPVQYQPPAGHYHFTVPRSGPRLGGGWP